MEGRYTTMSDQSVYQGPKYPTEEHGFTAETEPVKVRATRGLSANVQVRFDPETDHELEAIARERGMKKATLIRTWVLERLRQDRNRHAS